MLAVPEYHTAHIAHTVAVHKHPSGGDGAVELGRIGGELNDPADFADEDAPGVHAHVAGELGMGLEVPLLSVDGNKELGLDQSVNDFQLFLAGVAGDVQGEFSLIDHLGILAVELVDDVADGVFIAGNGGGGEDDPVARLNVHLPVGVEGHPGQGGHGFSR